MAVTTTPPHSTGLPRARTNFRFGQESGDATPEWAVHWRLARNCSMAPRQLLGFYLLLCTISLGVASFFWWQGARMVMPFAWAEMLAVAAAMLVYARHATDHESIALSRGALTVEHSSGTRLERVEFQPEWVNVEPRSGDRSLIELSAHGKRIEVGRFVRPELRRDLAAELRQALRLAQYRPMPMPMSMVRDTAPGH